LFQIDLNSDLVKLQDYLHQSNFLMNEQITSLEKPGEGNMNVVMRITTNHRSLILKQSRPFVQKYQQIEAPIDRIDVEQRFYEAIQSSAISHHVPKILGYDPNNYLLLLEDLGNCEDMVLLYEKRAITNEELQKLTTVLSLIHGTKAPDDFPDNLEMRRLNHQHIFVLPFLEDNGFSLDDVQPGLQELSNSYKNNPAIKREIETVGKKYLSKGNILLHGDYYPGSWITTENNLYIIDPEFSFMGFAEFDLGVMAGHLIMVTNEKKYLTQILENYNGLVDEKLVMKVAGIEIMRRIIGLAQLHLKRTIEEKNILLNKAYEMIMA